MARANVHGTGVFVTKGVRQLAGLRWKFKTTNKAVNTTPAIQGSTVFFGRDGYLYAVDTRTGTEKWNRKIDNQHTSAPAVAGDTLYVGGWEELYAIIPNTGLVRWIFDPEKGSDDSYFTDPVVDDGVVYFGGRHNLYALDSATGQEKWKVKLSSVTSSVPTVYDGMIYVGTYSPDGRDDTYLYALDSKTGQEKWKLKVTGDGIGGAVAVVGGVVYVGSTDDGLLALDAKNGQEKWRYYPGSGVTTGPAVAYDTVYITDRGKLYAVDAQSGQELWEFSVPGITSRDPVVSDGTVYFGSEEGTLYAVK